MFIMPAWKWRFQQPAASDLGAVANCSSKAAAFCGAKNSDILIISNDTRAAIQPTSASAKGQRPQSVVITSQGAEFNQAARQVRFWGHVSAQESTMAITSEWLTFKLRDDASRALDKVSTDNRIEQIVAETNVVVRLAENKSKLARIAPNTTGNKAMSAWRFRGIPFAPKPGAKSRRITSCWSAPPACSLPKATPSPSCQAVT